ncbi:MAG: hypothetical protein RIT03_647 [Bacteroidota bacterium]|jgi:uncharacterized protein YdeI (YjbR/CyaY-like superfamily)
MADEVKQHVWDKSGNWTAELIQLMEIIGQTQLEQTTKWGMPVYVHKGKNIVGVAGFKHFFTLWFFNGAALTDPSKVLINAQEGKTKNLRQWRFTKQDEINKALILQYLQEAIALEDAL